MSFDVAMARVAELQRLLQPQGPAPAQASVATASSFAGVLGQATATAATAGAAPVAATWDWAQRTGRAIPATQTPQPGDLIVWDGTHIGMVEAVLPDGRVQTIEGNSSNMVTRRVHGADGDGATGYVRMS